MENNGHNTSEIKPKNEGLFDEKSLDEMQKAENYKIGFRLFQACFWFMYFFSMYIFVAAVNMENTIFTVCGITAMAAATVFHIVYSAMVSAKGVMNPKYAEAMSKPHMPVVYTILLILYFFITMLEGHPIAFLMICMPWVMLTFDCFFARHNKKVLEKMLKNDDENE